MKINLMNLIAGYRSSGGLKSRVAPLILLAVAVHLVAEEPLAPSVDGAYIINALRPHSSIQRLNLQQAEQQQPSGDSKAVIMHRESLTGAGHSLGPIDPMAQQANYQPPIEFRAKGEQPKNSSDDDDDDDNNTLEQVKPKKGFMYPITSRIFKFGLGFALG